MSFDDALDVPPPKSARSTSATASPCRAAASAMPAPTMPPPITSRSNCSDASRSLAPLRHDRHASGGGAVDLHRGVLDRERMDVGPGGAVERAGAEGLEDGFRRTIAAPGLNP